MITKEKLQERNIVGCVIDEHAAFGWNSTELKEHVKRIESIINGGEIIMDKEQECENNIYVPELVSRKMKDYDYGDKMTVGQFIDKILEGVFIDYDGHCAFIIDKADEEYRVINATYSIDEDMVYIKDADNGTITTDLLNFCYTYNIRKIIWFNR